MATPDLKNKILHHLNEAQNGLHYHNRLVKSLKSVLEDEVGSPKDFFDAFLPPILNLLVIFKREPAAERLVEFVAKFTVAVTPKTPITEEDSSPSDEEIDSSKTFVSFLLHKLIELLKAKEKAIRFRSCQLISKILTLSSQSSTHRTQISSNLLHLAAGALLERLMDKFSIVRLHAMSALTYLQDPTDPDCPITTGMLWSMDNDSSFEVRKCAVLNICVTQKTLPALIARTRDVKDSVRSVAFLTLSEKCSIRNLTIEQRLLILNDGLRDESPQVKKSCVSGLLRSWCMSLEGDFLQLLQRLDVESSPQVVELVLMSLFDDIIDEELVKTFETVVEEVTKDREVPPDKQSGSTCLIPVTMLDCEIVFYWRCLCKYFKTKNSSYLERVSPTLTDFCHYFQSFLDTHIMPDQGEEESLDLQLSEEYKALQLCEIFSLLDFSDEVGRRQLAQMSYQLITNSKFPTSLVSPLLTEQVLIWPQESYRIEKLIEIIADIRYPGYSDSASINDTLSNLSYIDLKEDVGSLIKCLVVAGELFKELTLTKLSPPLQTLLESLLIPCIQNENPYVRDLAVYALGLACLLDINLARHHMLLFIQVSQVDHENVQATATKVVFDLLHLYGLEAFNVEHGKNNENSETQVETEEDTQDIITELLGSEGVNCESNDEDNKSVIHILAKFLSGESSLLLEVTCEGIAKLLLSDRIVSVPLLVRLLLIWYNPVHRDENKLRTLLGYFFSTFAAVNEAHRANLSETYLPFMQAVLDAPTDSPLCDTDVGNAADFIVNLSAPAHSNEDSSHDSLAIQLCNFVLSNDFDDEVSWMRIFCKTLTQLSLTRSNKTNARDALVLVDQLIKIVLDKQTLKSLRKFKTTLEKIVPPPAPSNDIIMSNEEINKENIQEMSSQSPPVTPPQSSQSHAHQTGNVKPVTRSKLRTKKKVPDNSDSEDDDDEHFNTPGTSKKVTKKRGDIRSRKMITADKTNERDEESDDSLIGEHSPFLLTARPKRTITDIPQPPLFTDDI